MEEKKWRSMQSASCCSFNDSDSDMGTVLTHNELFCDLCRDELIIEMTRGQEILFTKATPNCLSPSNNSEAVEMKDHQKQAHMMKKQHSSTSLDQLEIISKNNVLDSNTESCSRLKNIFSRPKTYSEGFKSNSTAKQKKSGTNYSEINKSTCRFMSKKKKTKTANVPTVISVRKLEKQGYSKEEALSKYIEIQRERAGPKLVTNKVQIDREEMPWVPSLPPILRKHFSVIEKRTDHQRYVAIVSNYLNGNHSEPRFQQNRQEISVMDEKLKNERLQYQELVLHSLSSRKKSAYMFSNHQVISYILDRLRSRALSLDGNYGAPIFDQDMKNVAEDTLTVLTKKSILHRGILPKIFFPNERRYFTFNCSVDDLSTYFPRSEMTEFPLKFDDLAMHLAIQHNVRVVMCCSSALKILCDSWVADSNAYLLPVVVKRGFSARTNSAEKRLFSDKLFSDRFENICLVDKPCIEKSVNGPSLNRRYSKLCMKLSIYGKLKQSTDEMVSLKGDERQRRVSETDTEELNDKHQAREDVLFNNVISDEEFQKESNTIAENSNKDGQNMKRADLLSSSAQISINSDFLGDIAIEMNAADNNLTRKCVKTWLGNCHLEKAENSSLFNGADLKKRYVLFTLGHDGMEDVDIIVRANNDGVDMSAKELCIVHKMEYAAEFGAENLDVEEWLNDYFRCKLKSASQLVRLRIHHSEQYLLQKECYNESALTVNRLDLRKLYVSLSCAERRAQRLKDVVTKLESLEVGKYLIRKDSSKLQILPSAENMSEPYLTKDRIRQLCFDEYLPPVKDIFRGIDEHLVLVYHMIQKRIPATFALKRNHQEIKDTEKNRRSVTRKAHRPSNQLSIGPHPTFLQARDASTQSGMVSSNRKSKRRSKCHRRNTNTKQ
ncbi:unnamed protein product [Thelazia callipaeda]|uniref:NARG2_C domain-containing protein n=1 Tax=Thelazia callipaeda TaxID=103827 RepID=A0A0N5CYW0_THECL|nr:unnamed protein product [Thelazia callipaeda]